MNDPPTTPMYPSSGDPSWYPPRGASAGRPYPGGPEGRRGARPESEPPTDPYGSQHAEPHEPRDYRAPAGYRSGPPDNGPKLNVGRLWAGGAATAIVAALIAVVGVTIGRGLFAVPIPVPAVGGLASGTYIALAAVAALVATGLAHLLVVVAPKPLAFFGWIVFLATVVAVIAPFVNSVFGSFSHISMLNSKVATAVINLVLGVAIGSLVVGVTRTSVTYRGPRPPVPPQGYITGMR